MLLSNFLSANLHLPVPISSCPDAFGVDRLVMINSFFVVRTQVPALNTPVTTHFRNFLPLPLTLFILSQDDTDVMDIFPVLPDWCSLFSPGVAAYL